MKPEEILNAISEFTGMDVSDFEKFKTDFESKAVMRSALSKDPDAISTATGLLTGKLKTKFKQMLELDPSEISDLKTPEEYVEKGVQKLKEKLKELEEIKNKGGDEQFLKVQEDLEKTKAKLKEELNAKKELQDMLRSKEEEWIGEKKNITIQTQLTAKKAELRSKMIELDEDKEYIFNNQLKERFKFDLDEEGNTIVMDKDGNRLKNPEKAGEFLDLGGALYEFAKQKDFIKKNNGGPIPAPVQGTKVPVEGVKQIDPKLQEHVNRLAQIKQESSSK